MKLRRLLLFCILLLSLTVGTTAAQSLEIDTFNVAKNLYDKGNYDEAAKLYEQLATEGVVDSALYYNLGTTYLRKQDFGRAVLNLRRGAELSPRDGDLRDQLLYAREQVAVDLPELLDGISGTVGWFTVNEALIAAFILWLIFLGFVFVNRNPKSERQRTAAQSGALLALGLLLLLGAVLGARLLTERNQPSAVVVVDSAETYLNPNTSQDPIDTLISGAELVVLETSGAWVNVRLAGGELEGWVSAETIERIRP